MSKKTTAEPQQETPTYVMVITIICFLAGIYQLFSLGITLTSNYFNKESEAQTVVPMSADYEFVRYFGPYSYRQFIGEPIIDFVNAKLTGQAVTEDGKTMNRFHITGVSMSEGETHPLQEQDEWIELGSFRKSFLPMDREGREAKFICLDTTEVKQGKVLQTIADDDGRRPVHIIEKQDGVLDFIDAYCEEVKEYQQIN